MELVSTYFVEPKYLLNQLLLLCETIYYLYQRFKSLFKTRYFTDCSLTVPNKHDTRYYTYVPTPLLNKYNKLIM